MKVSDYPSATLTNGSKLLGVTAAGLVKNFPWLGQTYPTPYDYGAVGDGTTNDDVAIQSWLNSGSAVLYAAPGNFVMLDGNTYGKIPNGVRRIFGPGTFTISPSAANNECYFFTDTYAGDSLDIDGLVFNGKEEAGSTGNTTCLSFRNTNTGAIRVRNCYFKTTGDFGVVPFGGDFLGTVEDCQFDAVKRSAIAVFTATTRGIWISRNRIAMKNTANYQGIAVNGLGFITDNYLTDGTSTAINFGIFLGGSSTGSRVIGNTISNWYFDGIEIFANTGETIQDFVCANNIVRNPSPSISIEIGIGLTAIGTVKNGVMIGNFVSRCGGTGLLIGFGGTCTDVLVSGNTIVDPNQGSYTSYNGGGIWLDGATRILVQNNHIISTDGKMLYGITDDNASGASRFFNNLIKGAATAQFLLAGSGTVISDLGTQVPVTKTADFTLGATENEVIVNKSGSACTVTLPTASTSLDRKIRFKTIQAQALNSASSNVVPLTSATAGTAILTGTAGKWAELISNGTNWVIQAGN